MSASSSALRTSRIKRATPMTKACLLQDHRLFSQEGIFWLWIHLCAVVYMFARFSVPFYRSMLLVCCETFILRAGRAVHSIRHP